MYSSRSRNLRSEAALLILNTLIIHFIFFSARCPHPISAFIFDLALSIEDSHGGIDLEIINGDRQPDKPAERPAEVLGERKLKAEEAAGRPSDRGDDESEAIGTFWADGQKVQV